MIFHVPWPGALCGSFSAPNPPRRLKISQNEALSQYASAKNTDIGCTRPLVSWKSTFLNGRSPKAAASFTARCPSAPYYSSSYRSTSHVKRSSRRSGGFQRSQVAGKCVSPGPGMVLKFLENHDFSSKISSFFMSHGRGRWMAVSQHQIHLRGWKFHRTKP